MVNRKTALFNLSDASEKNFMSLMCDKADKAILTDRRMYSKFISPRERLLAQERLAGDCDVFFFGGYDEAERTIACFSSHTTYETDFSYDIETILIESKNHAVFSHRDYLGSILGLGIKRELVGDILVLDTYALVFCHREIADYIIFNLKKIGRANVTVSVADKDKVKIPPKEFKEKSITVSSMRLDCVVSSATNKSRAVSSAMIEKGLVSVNYEVVENVSFQIGNGDTISVKGIGKMIVESEGHLTKKGRYHINIKEYI